MMKQRKLPDARIAVTGVGGGVGQAILRALRHAAPDSWTLGLDMNPRSAGLYTTQKGHILPPCSEPAYVDRLLEVLKAERIAVLIPGSDPELPVLARARPVLEDAGVSVIVGAVEPIDICRDKMLCSEFFRNLGIPFVKTVRAPDAAALADEIGYPLVVKPVGGSASRGVAVVFSDAELRPYLSLPGYIAQEPAFPAAWSRGRGGLNSQVVLKGAVLRQEEEISIQVVCDHQGQHLGTFTSVNSLQSGVPIYVDPQRIPVVESVVERMASALRDLGLVGPCNFQCRMTEQGPKAFEVNPRFTGITGVRAAMGFNEVSAVLQRLLYDAPIDAVRASLVQPSDRLSIRYVDELIVPRNRVEAPDV